MVYGTADILYSFIFNPRNFFGLWTLDPFKNVPNCRFLHCTFFYFIHMISQTVKSWLLVIKTEKEGKNLLYTKLHNPIIRLRIGSSGRFHPFYPYLWFVEFRCSKISNQSPNNFPSLLMSYFICVSVPARISSFSQLIQVPWKKDILLRCDVVGYPEPTVHWKFNGKNYADSSFANAVSFSFQLFAFCFNMNIEY